MFRHAARRKVQHHRAQDGPRAFPEIAVPRIFRLGQQLQRNRLGFIGDAAKKRGSGNQVSFGGIAGANQGST